MSQSKKSVAKSEARGQIGAGGRFSGVVKLAMAVRDLKPDRMTKGKAFGRLFAEYKQKHNLLQTPPSASSTSSRAKSSTPTKVGIIGAGMAGLYAAMLLQDFGIDYEILEANDSRIGGRVYTYHFNDDHINSQPGQPGYYNYVDLGAMRFPLIEIMDRVVGAQNWSLLNYLNSRLPANKQIKMLPYYLGVDNNLKLFNGIKMRAVDVDAQTQAGNDPLHFSVKHGGAVPDSYASQPYDNWLNLAYNKYKSVMETDFDKGFRDLMTKDYLSTSAYLRDFVDVNGQQQNYPFSVVNWCETLDSATGLYEEAFAESVMDSFDFDGSANGNMALSPQTGWACVDGGTDKFSQGITEVLNNKPLLSMKVNSISYNREAASRKMTVGLANGLTPRSYDHVICTLPPAITRTINTDSCNLSYDKRDALRCMHVDFAVKVNLMFTSRWWQDSAVMGGFPIKGGQSSTDRPIRTCVYPSQAVDVPGAPGILMCSYAWAQDAARLAGLPDADLLEVVLNDLTALHGAVVRATFTGQYKVVNWYAEPHANGAYALYGAGQFSNLYPKLLREECDAHLHFAGEATSVHHAWIVGALNSAYRTVVEILIAEGRGEDLKRLVQDWGVVEEVEFGLIQPFFNLTGVVKGVKDEVKRKVNEVKDVASSAASKTVSPAKKQKV